MFENDKEGVKDIRDLLVKDVNEISVGKPAVVYEDAILRDVVEAMTLNMKSRKVYVVDEESMLKGAVTIETVLKRVGYRVGVREPGMMSFFRFLGNVLEENVVDFMDDPVTISNNHKLLDALQKMVEFHLNDLPVVDEEGRIVGELNALEILKHAKRIFEE